MRSAASVAVIIAVLALVVARAPAYETGISGFSGKSNQTCAACHAGGTAPTVRFEGPTAVALGATVRFRFVLVSEVPSQDQAGLDVSVSGGTLQVVTGQRTRLISSEITHSDPKDIEDEEVFWEFDWIAPAAPGEQTLYGAGNAVNGNGQTTGDRSRATTFKVQVGATAPTPTPTPTVTVTETAIPVATETATEIPAATASATATVELQTATPTSEPTSTATVTETPSATATTSQAPTPSFTPTASVTEVPMTPTPTATATATVVPVCVGDCDGDQRVTVAELVTGVNIALDRAPISGCTPLDRDNDQRVTVAELVAAVTRAVSGCEE